MATAEYRKVRTKDVVVREPIRTDPGKIDELAGSLQEHGLLEPIVVRPEGDKLVLVAGSRRLAAAKKLGWDDIDAHVVEMSADEGRARQLAENVHRKDLGPMERARAVAAYVELRQKQDPKLTYEAIGHELQISQPEVSNTLLLLRQEVHVQKLVDDGQLTPGHIEHALAPLRAQAAKLHEEVLGKPVNDKELDAAVSKIAHEWARQKLDIRTAKQEAEDSLAKYKASLSQAKLVELVKGAKRKTCPTEHESWRDPKAVAYKEVGVRLILLCSAGADRYDPKPGHAWDADTGEVYMTPAEKKLVERQEAQRKRDRRAAAKAHTTPRERVQRDFAAFFSRATIAQWAHGRLDAIDKELEDLGFDEVSLNAGGTGRRGYGWSDGVQARPVDLPDGNGGKFVTRLEVQGFTSLTNGVDNVAESGAVKELRKKRAELLEFQHKALKVAQKDDDLWPVEVGGFKLGDKVRIGDKSPVASYIGKQGVILAFDVQYSGRTHGLNAPGKDVLHAVLDIGASTKVHPVSALEKPTKFLCAKCSSKVALVETKRICKPCGKSEGSCDCEPKKPRTKGAKA